MTHGAAALKDIAAGRKIQLNGNNTGLPEFSCHSFPSVLSEWAKELQRVNNIDAGYLLTCALVAAGALIGNKFEAEIKKGYYIKPVLYCLLVGHSGAGKTPAMKMALGRLLAYTIEAYRGYQEEAKAQDERRQQAKTANVEFTEKEIVFNKRYVFQNTTIEALYKHMENSFNGIAFVIDEFMDFFNNVVNGRYTGGSDRAKFLSFFDSVSVFIDTKKEGAKLIEMPCLLIIAGIQQGRLPELIGKVSDGFTERFLFVYNSLPYRAQNFEEVDPRLLFEYENTINKLIEMPFSYSSIGKIEPAKIPFDSAALTTYIKWSEDIAQRVRDAQTELSRSIYTKMQANCARIALILQMLYYVCNEDGKGAISNRAINSAIDLMEYYIATSFKAHTEAAEKSPLDSLTGEQNKLYNALPETVTTAEAQEIGSRFSMNDKYVSRFLNRMDIIMNLTPLLSSKLTTLS